MSAMKPLSRQKLVVALVCCFTSAVFCTTNPTDADVLNQFRRGLENPELLQWPKSGDDPCGPPAWKYVFCSKSRVTQIQVKGLGLKGTLPQNLNRLSMLSNVGLQRNEFSGPLPSFSGLSNLQYAFLDFNEFDSIPADFFEGLSNLQVLALDDNKFNASTGWTFPVALQDSAQLVKFSCMRCNLVGPLPDFLGSMDSLTSIRLSNNGLSGMIPASFKGMGLKTLWLNDQQGGGLNGQIDVVTTMESLQSLWIHGNQFTGTIPESIGNLANLKDLKLNGNKLTGVIPDSLANLPLDSLDLNNNQFMGPLPKFKAAKVTYSSNSFCQSEERVSCAPEVMVLIEFLGALNYPSILVSDWSGNDPCGGSWLGLRCNANNKIEIINLPNFDLSGELSPTVANLQSLSQVKLQSNNISSPIPKNWTTLTSLKILDLSDNNIAPPVPKFAGNVNLVLNGNPLLDDSGGKNPFDSPGYNGSSRDPANKKSLKRSTFWAIVVPVVCVCTIILFAIPLALYFYSTGENGKLKFLLGFNPKDPRDPDKVVKIDVADDNTTSTFASGTSNNTHLTTESVNNLSMSVEILRKVTNDFSPQNHLGRGGFGTVYKGQLEDGTTIAVKRMEGGLGVSNKAMEEFQAEIRVLSGVRHRNLVSLLGYSVEENEKLLVYEYMPQGALSKHLFHWKSLQLEPLSWKRRLNIALDVARGMEYLHSLAHRSFIHRDLKSSNILLDDDFRAKVSDFGLVKLAPEDERSVVTRLAGTFGYLAPEYAVTGKVTTKVDVFSFGVVLMELLTGFTALGEDRTEESQYLVPYFWRLRSNKNRLRAALDDSIDITDQTFEAISTVADLATHCTAREPSQRPDMSHAVNVLASYVEEWKPSDQVETMTMESEDYVVPLDQMVMDWQNDERSNNNVSYIDLGDSKGSISESSMTIRKTFGSSDGR